MRLNHSVVAVAVISILATSLTLSSTATAANESATIESVFTSQSGTLFQAHARTVMAGRARSTTRLACYVPDSHLFLVKPKRCQVTGSRGTEVFLSKMRWRRWGKNRAAGIGRIDYYDHPDLGGRVKVRLSSPKNQSCLPFRTFARATFKQVSGAQRGNRFSLRNLQCPHSG